MLHEDLEMRRIILARLRNAGIAKIETERSSNAQLTVTIHTAKPGIVIGKGGSSVDQLREDLEKRFGNRVRISNQEILRTMRAGAKGVRIYCGGRLRGAEMARREWDREGRVPLHTLRADIDFGRATAKTTFGAIGVKCWIYKDQITPAQRRLAPIAEEAAPIGEIVAPRAEPPEAAAPPVVAAVVEPEAAPAPAPRPRRPRAAASSTPAAAPAAEAEPKKPAVRARTAAPKAKAETAVKAPAKKPAARKKADA